MPKRIQLKRTKGWKMPPNTVSVTRPGRWGNLFKGDPVLAVRAFKTYAKAPIYRQMVQEALRGKNLACWCKPGAPCHADVLLEIANG